MKENTAQHQGPSPKKTSFAIPIFFLLMASAIGGIVYLLAISDITSFRTTNTKPVRQQAVVSTPTEQVPGATPPKTAPSYSGTSQPEAALPPSFVLPMSNATAQNEEHNRPSDATTPLPVLNATPSKVESTSATPEVIEFSKASPTPEGGAVRGHAFTGQARSPQAQPKGGYSDALVSRLFLQDLANTLVANYWPKGTHPIAKYQSALTINAKWLNSHYGNQLTGLGTNKESPELARAKVLHYTLMPSMVDKLYTMYHKEFIRMLVHTAGQQKRATDNGERPLSKADTADMLTLFATQAKYVSGALSAYTNSVAAQNFLQKLEQTEDQAAKAHSALIDAMDSENGEVEPPTTFTNAYQNAIAERKKVMINLAAAMREAGNTGDLDADMLTYIASWADRRGPESAPALKQVAKRLYDLAIEMENTSQEILHESGITSPTVTDEPQ